MKTARRIVVLTFRSPIGVETAEYFFLRSQPPITKHLLLSPDSKSRTFPTFFANVGKKFFFRFNVFVPTMPVDSGLSLSRLPPAGVWIPFLCFEAYVSLSFGCLPCSIGAQKLPFPCCPCLGSMYFVVFTFFFPFGAELSMLPPPPSSFVFCSRGLFPVQASPPKHQTLVPSLLFLLPPPCTGPERCFSSSFTLTNVSGQPTPCPPTSQRPLFNPTAVAALLLPLP